MFDLAATAPVSAMVTGETPDPKDPSAAVPEPYPPGLADGAATGRPP